MSREWIDLFMVSRYNDTIYCRYHDYREPPWAENKYKYSAQHWNMVAAQFIFVMLFEVKKNLSCRDFLL